MYASKGGVYDHSYLQVGHRLVVRLGDGALMVAQDCHRAVGAVV